jgi:hypothetical protein
MCASDPGRIIAHPELDWVFNHQCYVLFHADQTDPEFDLAFLRIGNYWDAMCMAPREAYARHRFGRRAVADGFAYEDWHWNIDTLTSGFVHRVVPETVHFKRRREGSQTREAFGNQCLTRPSPFYDYARFAELERGAAEA